MLKNAWFWLGKKYNSQEILLFFSASCTFFCAPPNRNPSPPDPVAKATDDRVGWGRLQALQCSQASAVVIRAPKPHGSRLSCLRPLPFLGAPGAGGRGYVRPLPWAQGQGCLPAPRAWAARTGVCASAPPGLVEPFSRWLAECANAEWRIRRRGSHLPSARRNDHANAPRPDVRR